MPVASSYNLLCLLSCVFVFFHSCCTHAQVLWTTLVHELNISHSNTELYTFLHREEGRSLFERRQTMKASLQSLASKLRLIESPQSLASKPHLKASPQSLSTKPRLKALASKPRLKASPQSLSSKPRLKALPQAWPQCLASNLR